MKKCIVFCMIIITILASFHILAEDSKVLSLEEAKEIARTNNTSIKAADLNITKSKLSMDEQKYAHDKAVRDSQVSYNLEMLKVKKGYYYRVAQMGHNISLLKMDQTKDMISFSVESKYFSLLNANEKVSLMTDAHKLSESNFEKVKKRYELGMISAIEFTTAKNQLDSGKYDLDKAKREQDLARIDLCNLLGISVDTNFTLISKLDTPELTDFNLQTAMETAVANRLEVFSAKEQYECDKLDLASTGGFYTPNTYKYKSAEHNLLISENNISLSENAVKMNIRQLYNFYLDAFEALPLADNLIAQAETTLKITSTKFENGMCTYNELLQAENAVKEAKLSKAQGVLGLNLAVKQLEYAQKTGLGIGQ